MQKAQPKSKDLGRVYFIWLYLLLQQSFKQQHIARVKLERSYFFLPQTVLFATSVRRARLKRTFCCVMGAHLVAIMLNAVESTSHLQGFTFVPIVKLMDTQSRAWQFR